MIIRSRLWLAIALVVGQALILGPGLLLYFTRVAGDAQRTARSRALDTHENTARRLARMIAAADLESIEAPTDGWRWLQDKIEQIDLPDETRVSIIGRDGRRLCHPDFQENPDLLGTMVGDTVLRDLSGQPLGSLGEATASLGLRRVVSGSAALAGGDHLVAAAPLAGHGALVLVSQPEASLRSTTATLARKTVMMGIRLAVLIVVSVGLVAWFLIRQYESRLAAINEHLEDEVDRRTRDLTATRDAVIFGMAKLSESRDVDTGQHLLRIQRYVQQLALQLRELRPALRGLLTEGWICDLGLSSVLHDIGKVGVPDSILLKPARLTKKEFEKIKRHTLIGGDCLYAIEKRLGESNFLVLAREIAYAHHEHWDGGGYPFGLSADIIPLSARIVALADVYDALTTDRPYKPALTHERAVTMITRDRSRRFDPDIVDAFLAVEGAFDALRRQFQSDEAPSVHADAA